MRIVNVAVSILIFNANILLVAETLPKDLKWEASEKLPSISSPEAKKGGTITLPISTYPLTLRVVGPDSNTVLYMAINYNNWSLVEFHPNTKEILPLLATQWAYGSDGRTMYFKLDPKAKWSDGHSVTADDFAYTMEFMRSKNIMAPWYNNYYTEEIEKVTVYDQHTLSVTIPQPKPDLFIHVDIPPTPKHFYKTLTPDFVQKYNWTIVPNTGPYQITKLDRGKAVAFSRKKDWWGKDRPYFKNRFNVDQVVYKVIRERAVQWEHFKKGQLDVFGLGDPEFWHDKSNIDIFQKGYAHKIWFYTDAPEICFGMWLNKEYPVFKDLKVRQALAYAMNFDKVMHTLQRGEAERLNGCTEGYGEYTNKNIKAKPFDLAKANKLLDEAGWTKRDPNGIRMSDKGERLEFSLMYAADAFTQELVLLTEEAKKAGIDIKLDYKDWSAMVKQKNANKHQATYSGYGARDSGIPDYYGIWHGENANQPNSNNTSNLNNPELNKFIDIQSKSSDKAERIKLAHKIQEIIDNETVMIPMYTRPYVRMAYWRWWRLPKPPGTKISESTFELFDPKKGGLFWFDEQLKKDTQKAMKANKTFPPVTVMDKTYKRS